MAKLLAVIPADSPACLRLRALVLAYLLTGRRRSEVLNLRWQDLDLEGGFYRCTGALGWTLEQVAAQAQVSVGMLSLIETGKRRPSLKSWGRIREALSISEPLPEEAWRQQPREISDELVATLGACLADARQATLAELAAATGVSIADVRLGLRRLAEQLEPAGMQVLDEASHVQALSGGGCPAGPAGAAASVTQEMAEVLAIVIMEGMATRRRIEEIRGAAQLSIGTEGPVSLPRDSSETLALLLSRGLLCAERDDHATGRPLVYRPTPAAAAITRRGDFRGGEDQARGVTGYVQKPNRLSE